MNITTTDHIEFYVGDAQQSAFFLCTAFGFRLSAQSSPDTRTPTRRSLLLRHGRIQLQLTSALSEQDDVAGYVSRHGDGVAVIGVGTDDARAAFAEAVQRGAGVVREPVEYADEQSRVVTAEVKGFGDIAYRFVERHGAPGNFLPGEMDELVADPDSGDELLDVIDHIAVCLPAGELDATVEYHKQVFGFDQVFEEHIMVGTQAMDSKVVQSASGGVTLTMLEPDSSAQPGQIDEFVDRHGGAGVQHLAFLSDDIVAAVDTFQRRGVRFLRTPASYYDQVEKRLGDLSRDVTELRRTNVLVDRDHWGEMFQIFTESMHVRRTYFMEIIDRHGARTFGSGNIKALYEAVERDRAEARQTTV